MPHVLTLALFQIFSEGCKKLIVQTLKPERLRALQLPIDKFRVQDKDFEASDCC